MGVDVNNLPIDDVAVLVARRVYGDANSDSLVTGVTADGQSVTQEVSRALTDGGIRHGLVDVDVYSGNGLSDLDIFKSNGSSVCRLSLSHFVPGSSNDLDELAAAVQRVKKEHGVNLVGVTHLGENVLQEPSEVSVFRKTDLTDELLSRGVEMYEVYISSGGVTKSDLEEIRASLSTNASVFENHEFRWVTPCASQFLTEHFDTRSGLSKLVGKKVFKGNFVLGDDSVTLRLSGNKGGHTDVVTIQFYGNGATLTKSAVLDDKEIRMFLEPLMGDASKNLDDELIHRCKPLASDPLFKYVHVAPLESTSLENGLEELENAGLSK